jgi:hypothetical protein
VSGAEETLADLRTYWHGRLDVTGAPYRARPAADARGGDDLARALAGYLVARGDVPAVAASAATRARVAVTSRAGRATTNAVVALRPDDWAAIAGAPGAARALGDGVRALLGDDIAVRLALRATAE